jgi:hypothetical protein
MTFYAFVILNEVKNLDFFNSPTVAISPETGLRLARFHGRLLGRIGCRAAFGIGGYDPSVEANRGD